MNFSGRRMMLCGMALVTLMPNFVCAEDQTATSPSDKTVQLTATKASSYTVTLPKSVDISADSTKFDVSVQGDINGNEKIIITMQDTTITETGSGSVKHEDIPVTVEFGTGKSQSYTHSEIKDLNTKQATLTHASIPAGTWSGSLNVNIKVETTQ